MPPKTTKKKAARKRNKASRNGRAPEAPPYINPSLAPLVRSIEGLVEDPRNARLHPQRNLDDIRRSLFAFHQQTPIVALRDGTVIKGNGTLRVALASGWQKIACITFDGTAEDALAYGIADNRTGESSEWDDEKLADLLVGIDGDVRINTGFDETEIGELLHGLGRLGTPEGEGNTDADDVPEPPAKPITKPGDLWALGEHRLLCGDATVAADVERVMGGERAALGLHDPPYGIGIGKQGLGGGVKNRRGKPKAGRDKYPSESWDDARIDPRTCLSSADVVVIWGANHYADKLPPKPGWIVWDKRESLGPNDFSDAELAWCSAGNTVRIIRHMWSGLCRKAGEEAGPRLRRVHPTQKPIAVMATIVSEKSERGDLVTDWYAGSGTTIIACEQLGRRCRAIEIEPRYVDVTCQRFLDYTGKAPTRESDGATWTSLQPTATVS